MSLSSNLFLHLLLPSRCLPENLHHRHPPSLHRLMSLHRNQDLKYFLPSIVIVSLRFWMIFYLVFSFTNQSMTLILHLKHSHLRTKSTTLLLADFLQFYFQTSERCFNIFWKACRRANQKFHLFFSYGQLLGLQIASCWSYSWVASIASFWYPLLNSLGKP